MPFSIVILTLNEERDLPRCLASVSFCDDLVVLDSGSTDKTVEIAKGAGARVFTRKFDNFGGQRNFAQSDIPFRHPWVFHLDADETFTEALRAECESVCQAARGVDGFYVAPKMMYEGRWIPRCTDYPAYQARFVRAPQFRFIEVGHGQREAPDMKLEHLKESYLHDLSSGGSEDWLTKHRRYAKAEAKNYLAAEKSLRISDLFSRDRLRRRRTLKAVSYRMPFRPLLRFVYQYLIRRGFLDGRPGYDYCRLLAQYEGFATREIAQLRRTRSP